VLTLGMIVLDGEPYLERAIRSAYATGQISAAVIVEGAVPASGYTDAPWGRPVSTDGTYDTLLRLQSEIPDLSVVCAGSQRSKNDMWDVCLEHLPPRHHGWHLQLDADEVLETPSAMAADMHGGSRCVHMRVQNYYGDERHVAHGGMWDGRHRRLWPMAPGRRYTGHRPPVLSGTEEIPWCDSGTRISHYGYSIPEIVARKCRFYESLLPYHPHYGRQVAWYHEVYLPSLRGECPPSHPGGSSGDYWLEEV
jgi:hypothetical protein